jgi:two-component system nitrogen regulation response regulator NtrX
MTELLLVEDDGVLRASMAVTLREDGYAVDAVSTLSEARERLGEGLFPGVLLLDVRLSETESGVDLVRELAFTHHLPPTIVVSGAATIAETVEALRLGVFDFLEKPVSKEHLLQAVRNAVERARLERRVLDLESRLEPTLELLGTSAAMQTLREQITRVAATDARVLITGETGTGKELVATQIHRQSRRRDRPFVKLNCAALPAPLVEAELFGHARGAYTDARNARAGLFEEANGGTLLLDEVGDMDLGVQARLLRVLEDGRVRRLGETVERQVDVRVLAATNRDLEQEAAEGRFRSDLFFRLAHLPIVVPPLRGRSGDVPLLVRHFVARLAARHRLRPMQIQDDVFPPLEAYGWPGNVRELHAVCERLVVLGSDPLTAEQLPTEVFQKGPVAEGGWLRPSRLALRSVIPFRSFKADCEREYLEAVLQRCGWSVTDAARCLGLHRTHLHAKVVALGIARPGRPMERAAKPKE